MAQSYYIHSIWMTVHTPLSEREEMGDSDGQAKNEAKAEQPLGSDQVD